MLHQQQGTALLPLPVSCNLPVPVQIEDVCEGQQQVPSMYAIAATMFNVTMF
jgi:hypothetical protein